MRWEVFSAEGVAGASSALRRAPKRHTRTRSLSPLHRTARRLHHGLLLHQERAGRAGVRPGDRAEPQAQVRGRAGQGQHHLGRRLAARRLAGPAGQGLLRGDRRDAGHVCSWARHKGDAAGRRALAGQGRHGLDADEQFAGARPARGRRGDWLCARPGRLPSAGAPPRADGGRASSVHAAARTHDAPSPSRRSTFTEAAR